MVRYMLILCFAAAPLFGLGTPEKPRLEKVLYTGNLEKGASELSAYCTAKRDDAQALYELGIVRFLRAVEGLAQDMYRFGPQESARFIPILRIPVPDKKDPEKITYRKFRKVLSDFSGNLAAARKTFESVPEKELKVPVFIGSVIIDIDKDGKPSEWETLWVIFERYNAGARSFTKQEALSFSLTFDTADVHWFIGYCHLLEAMCDIMLTYDFELLFGAVAPYLFRTADESDFDILDQRMTGLLLNFKNIETPRRASALGHLLAMISESRACFADVRKETDDDFEWIPNPKQTGVFGGTMTVTDEIIDEWLFFLDEAESLLTGKKLIPVKVSRTYTDEGLLLSLKKIILEPVDLNIMQLITGKGLKVWADEGPEADRQTLERLGRIFGGEFFGFALWFN
jgi:hypothetical protein